MKVAFAILLLLPYFGISQISGKIIEQKSTEPVFDARVESSEGQQTKSDFDGKFSLSVANYPVWIYYSAIGFPKDSIELKQATNDIVLELTNLLEIEKVVVSASRRAQDINEVPISMEILEPEMINNKGLVNVEQAVDQCPGVFAMDGQVSIRGGGGYSYGAGSRVLVMSNGIPLISPDLGDAKWNAIPMENLERIEVIKGASSVLYGSGALNGIISLIDREPSKQGNLSAKVQSGVYANPKRESLQWWARNPTFHMLDVSFGQLFDKWGFTFGGNGFINEGYKEGETEERVRLNGSLFFKPEKIKRLKVGFNYNAQLENVGKFILWESDSLAYTPFGGSDMTDPSSSLTYESSIRLNVDPYVKYFDKNNNKHELKTRYYLVTIGNANALFSTSKAETFFSDYQFSKNWGEMHHFTGGLTNSYNSVVSTVFGEHSSINSAAYGQYDYSKNRWDITGGIRLEYFQQDNLTPDSQFDFWGSKTSIPIYPIVRLASHYAVTDVTHVRASFGQGIRFPSTAERYAATSNGGVLIFPNPDLKPESGWAVEVGGKQIVKMGKWKGVIDVAAFMNQYANMIEYTFGAYNPDTIPLSGNESELGYYMNWLGFQAKNAEEARITGIEFSFNSQGKIKEIEIQSLMGYTYMNPRSLNTDSVYLATFSDSGNTILKYRFNHMAKIDVQATYKMFSVGFSSRYNSYMRNIDVLFEEGIAGQEVLPGLKQYRHANQFGGLVFDVRFGYKFKERYRAGVIVNNLLNAEYSSRPADIQPPRQFILQLQYGI